MKLILTHKSFRVIDFSCVKISRRLYDMKTHYINMNFCFFVELWFYDRSRSVYDRKWLSFFTLCTSIRKGVNSILTFKPRMAMTVHSLWKFLESRWGLIILFNRRLSGLSELTPIIFNMELLHLGLKTSNYIITLPNIMDWKKNVSYLVTI